MLTNNKLRICSLVLALVFLVSSASFASFSAKTIGLGDSFVTITGADALYGNPAAVNANQDVFTLELSGGAEAWNNLLANDYIPNDEKDSLLNKISDSGFIIRPAARGGAKLIIGPVATAVDMRAEGVAKLSPDIAEILLKGNELEETYKLDGSGGIGGAYGDASINVSLPGPDTVSIPIPKREPVLLKDVYVGFTYHQLFAGMISKLEGSGDTTLGYDSNGDISFSGNGEFTLKYNNPESISKMAGGSAIDLGTYAQLNDTYSVGFSIMNIGSLSAPADTAYIQTYETSVGDNENDTEVTKDGEEKPLNESLKYRLPATYRLGGKMDFSEDVKFFADYSYTRHHLGETIGEHKFSAATEAAWLGFLPLRTGLSYSTLRNEFTWSTGLGLYLGPLKAEAGVSDLLGAFNNSKGMQAAVTAKIEF